MHHWRIHLPPDGDFSLKVERCLHVEDSHPSLTYPAAAPPHTCRTIHRYKDCSEAHLSTQTLGPYADEVEQGGIAREASETQAMQQRRTGHGLNMHGAVQPEC